MSADRDPHVLLGRVIDAATDLCHVATSNNAARLAHLEELLWTLYEGIYGHREAEGIDPFKTAVGGALEVHKAWKGRSSTQFQAVGFIANDGCVRWEPNMGPGDLNPGQLVYVSHLPPPAAPHEQPPISTKE